jgi:threonyl-tRNA synthetase
MQPGEGAFYGPKIEFSLKDCIGRVWQCGTMQVDFSMPGRLGASYVDEDGEAPGAGDAAPGHPRLAGALHRHPDRALRRASAGLAGAGAGGGAEYHRCRQAEYAAGVAESPANQGFRVESDLRNEKIGFKIREHTLEKMPYLLVVGDREVENGTSPCVRARQDLGA